MKDRRKLSLIGAGPGDPELITIKGARALADADVVLYDALVSEEMLNYARKSAEKIYVGKRCGKHSTSQEEINKLIVQHALLGKHVARLKCGDPFVFGRGQEEMDFAKSFNIPVDIVLGVSSVGLSGLYGIPLTHRNYNQSFWVLTATTKKHEFSHDIQIAAQSSATLVILMGLKRIRQIADTLIAAGKSDLPIALIGKGSHHDQQVLVDRVDQIADRLENQDFPSPAIIVVGEVVRLLEARQLSTVIQNHLKSYELQ